MTSEEPELLTHIHDFAILFYLTLRHKSSEWLQSSIRSDLGIRFAIWNRGLAIRAFAFFKHCFLCKNRLLKRVSYLLIFVIQENELFLSGSVILYFFRS